MNAYLKEFSPDIEGQETAPLPADAIWKNKMIEQGFNYADSTVKEMTGFFEIRVVKIEFKEEKWKSLTGTK